MTQTEDEQDIQQILILRIADRGARGEGEGRAKAKPKHKEIQSTKGNT